MKTVILAGGLGSRLSEETQLKPKPMVEVGDKPMLWHIMNIYAAHGVKEFVVALGYKGEVIVNKKKSGEQKRFRYKPDGLRKRRNFRGNTVTQDTRQINLKVVEAGKKPLATILAAEGEEASE